MREKTGFVKQPFTVTVNAEKVMDYFFNLIREAIISVSDVNDLNINDYDFDGIDLSITGDYKTRFTVNTYAPFPLEPPEIDITKDTECAFDIDKLNKEIEKRLPIEMRFDYDIKATEYTESDYSDFNYD